MVVKGFKLNQKGIKGITAHITSSKVGDDGNTVTDIAKGYTRKIPIPSYLDESMKRLKYSYLVLTRRWDPSWDKFVKSNGDIEYDDLKELEEFEKRGYQRIVSLMEDTTVTGCYKKDNGDIYIIGEIKLCDCKVINTTTPIFGADEDEEVGIYYEAVQLVDECLANARKYLDAKKMDKMEPRQFLLSKHSTDEEKIMEINQLTASECEEQMMEMMASDGGYMFTKIEDLGIEEVKEEVEEVVEQAEESPFVDVPEDIIVEELVEKKPKAKKKASPKPKKEVVVETASRDDDSWG